MSENKTKATEASVEDYLVAIADEGQREDCRALVTLLGKVTKEPPKVWGYGIVGFGSYHYKYESGREGDGCLTGFAARKGKIAVYLLEDSANQEALLAKLGKYKMGKCCLSLRRLSDVDTKVLEQLVAGSVVAVKKRYGKAGKA